MRYQYQIITTGAGIVDWKQGVFEKNAKILKIIEIFEKTRILWGGWLCAEWFDVTDIGS